MNDLSEFPSPLYTGLANTLSLASVATGRLRGSSNEKLYIFFPTVLHGRAPFCRVLIPIPSDIGGIGEDSFFKEFTILNTV